MRLPIVIQSRYRYIPARSHRGSPAAWPIRLLVALLRPVFREMRRQDTRQDRAETAALYRQRLKEGRELGLSGRDLRRFVHLGSTVVPQR